MNIADERNIRLAHRHGAAWDHLPLPSQQWMGVPVNINAALFNELYFDCEDVSHLPLTEQPSNLRASWPVWAYGAVVVLVAAWVFA
jgi:hypothetical protein